MRTVQRFPLLYTDSHRQSSQDHTPMAWPIPLPKPRRFFCQSSQDHTPWHAQSSPQALSYAYSLSTPPRLRVMARRHLQPVRLLLCTNAVERNFPPEGSEPPPLPHRLLLLDTLLFPQTQPLGMAFAAVFAHAVRRLVRLQYARIRQLIKVKPVA